MSTTKSKKKGVKKVAEKEESSKKSEDSPSPSSLAPLPLPSTQHFNLQVLRVPKSQESHPKFTWLVTVYGFTTFKKGSCIPEQKALDVQPIVAETQVIDAKRNMEQNIRLPICWSFRLDCEHTFGEQKVSWKNVEQLIQCNLLETKFLTEIEYNTPLTLGWSHQGTMKHLRTKIESTEVQVFCQSDGVMGYAEEDNQSENLFTNEKLVKVINKLWDFQNFDAFVQYCQTEFPKSRKRQVGLLFSAAFNNLIAKTRRNQIMFV